MHLCYCDSKKNYAACCGLFIDGEKSAKTVKQLMRSRYTAYSKGGCGAYLLATWFPATVGNLSAAELDIAQANWQRLEVLDSSQSGDEGMVEFKAYFTDATHSGEQCMHERSVFSRVKGRWYYVGGEVNSG